MSGCQPGLRQVDNWTVIEKVRPAEHIDRRALAVLLAALADERDGIASEPPIDVDGVAKSWRDRGTGQALVAASIAWPREHGLHKLALSVSLINSVWVLALDARETGAA